MKNITILLIFAILFSVSVHAINDQDDPGSIAGVIEYKLSPNHKLRIGDISIYPKKTLRGFYESRDFRPAWENADINYFMKSLYEIEADGLQKEDYYYTEIIDLIKAEDTDNLGVISSKADLEILLSYSLSKLFIHLRNGKIDPKSLKTEWDIDKKHDYSTTMLLFKALASDNLYEFIEQQKPQLSYYKSLKRAYSKFEQYRENGGWIKVPGGATLKPGMYDKRITSLRDRLVYTGHLLESDNFETVQYDEQLVEAVKKFQRHHNLNADGIVGPNTLKELNVSVDKRIDQIKVNLERARWVLNNAQYKFVIVNIAGFKAYYAVDGEILWSSRIQVGKPYRKTPVFKSEIKHLVFNPSWSVPPGIFRKDILPIIKRNPGYLKRRGFNVYNSAGRKVSPTSINWAEYSRNVPYSIRQRPGSRNALGRVKFIFPNDHFVYLHDTPNRSLFNKDIKTFSSGCIRVEKPFELAELLLNDKEKWNQQNIQNVIKKRKTRTVFLDDPVPIMILYWTASADNDGNVYFMNDIYGRDKAILKLL
ncbi:MAG: L,D-transpeptidase family protein [Candidatus Dadabacteria bacterium]|nr:L,D-transpeptidase family protein [Candidatus Dadabacteria bacterium]NIS10218.1 L,D-transpeptidase family protein [Candidatus Dadabacteria bacterium]NIV42663.1 L,D-transpeptidase family protein [Candidatus Dadabacteria bacterium]NIX16586.1 L,D-transpeptidase family protein [Candidatus Dadabacteria bacterium]NIY23133.1 L,D-transpeptidase family protein [Candidatus Dadabacteria bacterium]